eukprot:TRINITY_DN11592_c0_g1_i1.p1 TRINITY_DN11592_c0_g1~~TRINITY_DN11592_c0_g1_i1.p1  ORF type:complete len:184 (+),score=43.06 TRINITY_DN11592_c0_g1_i1:48-554(+)
MHRIWNNVVRRRAVQLDEKLQGEGKLNLEKPRFARPTEAYRKLQSAVASQTTLNEQRAMRFGEKKILEQARKRIAQLKLSQMKDAVAHLPPRERAAHIMAQIYAEQTKFDVNPPPLHEALRSGHVNNFELETQYMPQKAKLRHLRKPPTKPPPNPPKPPFYIPGVTKS